MVVNIASAVGSLDASLPTLISEFKLLRQETGVCRKVATHQTLKPHTGTSKIILNYDRLSAYNLADGMDMVQAQALADAQTSYTPTEVGVQVVLAWSAMRRVADPDLLRQTSRMMTMAYDRKEDQDGCAQFTSFTPIVGSLAGNTVMGLGHVSAALAILRIGNSTSNPEPAPEPIYGVIHPNMLHTLAMNIVPLNASSAGGSVGSAGVAGAQRAPGTSAYGDEVLRRGVQAAGTIFGVPIYADANISVDSNADASGAFFSKEGFRYTSEVEAHMEPDESDKSLRGTEVNLWGSYNWGLYRNSAFGVEFAGDATVPTS